MFSILMVIWITLKFVEANETVMIISTEGCTIPDYPVPSELLPEFENPQLLGCDLETKQLLNSNTSHIWVNQEAFDLYNIYDYSNFYCCYKNMSAFKNMQNIKYAECKEFTISIKAEHEFVRAECFYNDDRVYENYYLWPSKGVVPPRNNKLSYNILVLGIENMSRKNFHRTMPLTSKLLQDLGMIEMLGYNKLGDNSFPNLFPLLTGSSLQQLKNTSQWDHTKAASYQFIWDKFRTKSYYTVLGADSPAGLLGSFENNLSEIPTDFYLQPFIMETRNIHRHKSYHYHKCLHSKYYYQILLDYIYGITDRLKNNRYFAIFWEESISHDHLTGPRVTDEAHYDLLTKLCREHYLKDTILIILSDHGMRWGPISLSPSGYQETRLPLLGILLPEKFRQEHKVAYNNLRDNSKHLTTPFDVHETLLHLTQPELLPDDVIIKMSESDSSVWKESSLFLPISGKRRCGSIDIDEHWCACYRSKVTITDVKLKNSAARKLLWELRRLLRRYSQCQRLFIDEIIQVSLADNEAWKTYTVVVKTKPGGGIFESTLVQSGTTWVVSGTVSRLNLYGSQSVCVDDVTVKMYCYC